MANDVPPPDISVLVTAHNRKNFLPLSIASVRKQTLDKDRYEIVVASNFELDAVQAIFKGVKHVFVEGSPGYCLSKALEVCRGSIIAVLDDDDAWIPQKLQILYDAFASDENLGFYHNNLRTVDNDGNLIVPPIHAAGIRKMERVGEISTNARDLQYGDIRRLIYLASDFNNSSIAFRKSLLEGKEDILREAESNTDSVIFYIAASSDSRMVSNGEALTLYRIHTENITGGNYATPDSYLARRLAFTRKAISQCARLLSDERIAGRHPVRRSIECMMIDHKLESYWFGQDAKRRDLVKDLVRYLRHFSFGELRYNFGLTGLSLIYMVHPEFVVRFYLGRYR